jgi:SOS-response transcriptional repressor LexA
MSSRRNRHRQRDGVFRLAGAISQGQPIDAGVAGERLTIPAEIMEENEIVYRVGQADLQGLGLERGDLLVVEPRPAGKAATGELVIATIGDRVFVGHWWRKHGRRALMSDRYSVVAEEQGLRIAGAINAIFRLRDGSR